MTEVAGSETWDVKLLVAAALAAGTLVAPAAPLVATVSASDGLTLGAVTSCAAPGAARTTLRARSATTSTFTAVVNSRTVKAGALRPVAGVVSVVVAVPADRTSRVVLRLAGRAVVNSLVTPSCPVTVPTPVVAPVTVPGPRGDASAYTLNKNSNGTVVRWNPCDGPITVRVNAPADALADVQAALAAARAATGLDLEYAGTTDFLPSSTNVASQPADLVIAWATRAQSDHWSPGAIGVGGWQSRGTSTDGTHWTWKIASGFVVVDPAAQVSPGFGRGATRGALLLHELAHALGLDHTTAADQVMYPSLSSTSYGSYGAGDLAGLAKVGAGQGCVSAA